MDRKTFGLFESSLVSIGQKLKEHRLPLLAGLLFGLLAHFSAFANKPINTDEVYYLFGKGATIDSGRWGLSLMSYLFPDISMPWIYGLITLILITVSGCIMLRMLEFRSRILQVLLMGVLVSFPSLTGLYSYMFTSTSYGVAFLLATLAPYWLVSNNRWKMLLSIPLMILSLGIYQPYISVTAALLLTYLIKNVLRNGSSVKSLWIQGLIYGGFVILTMGLYYGFTVVLMKLLGVQFNTYSTMSFAFDLKGLPRRIVITYLSFFSFFTEGNHRGIALPWVRIFTIAVMVVGAIFLAVWFFRNSTLGRKLLLLVCLALLPPCVNTMPLLITPDSIHTVVIYGFVVVYFFLALLFDNPVPLLYFKRAGKVAGNLYHRLVADVFPIVLVVTVIANIYLANAFYLKVHLSYEHTYSFYNNLSSEIVNNPEYDEDTVLAVIGSTPSDLITYGKEFRDIHGLMGSNGVLITTYAKEQFMKYYLGMDVKFADRATIWYITHSDEFKEMPSYPYYGCIRKFDNCLVVKLSDN
ncbi:MAG: glucosyltransferase domain-containing protein [Oscillospiraceae bacterium]|nr:glucosyltransferase domain-containing protein [Oscillospiraceae bacterium]